MAANLQEADYSAIADRIYIEGWALALTFGAVEQGLAHSWWSAGVCAVMSAFCQFIVIRWSAWIKARPDSRIFITLNNVAIDARWWIGTGMIFVVYIALSPYIEQQRWPFSIPAPAVATGEDIAKAIAPIQAEKVKALDDLSVVKEVADRWRFSSRLRSASVDDASTCLYRVIHTDKLGISSLQFWQELFRAATWKGSIASDNEPSANILPGITIRTSGNIGVGFHCASELQKALSDIYPNPPAKVVTDQSTEFLNSCGRNCLQIEMAY